MATTWTFGIEGSGLRFTIAIDESGYASVEMLEGSMDLNALWFSDGDTTKDGDVTLVNREKSLAMSSSASLDADGNPITWDEVTVLSYLGLGKEGTAKTTYLTTGETTKFELDAGTQTFLKSLTDLSSLTLGVSASSVDGGGRVALNAIANPEPTVFVSVRNLGGVGQPPLAWLDQNQDGVQDAGEAVISVTKSQDYPGFAGPVDTYSLDGIDFANKEVTIQFWQLDAGALDLSGFTADDKIKIDFATMTDALGGVFGSEDFSAGRVNSESAQFIYGQLSYVPKTGFFQSKKVVPFVADLNSATALITGRALIAPQNFVAVFGYSNADVSAVVSKAQLELTWPDPS